MDDDNLSVQERTILAALPKEPVQERQKPMLSAARIARLFRQQYRIVGNHSAVKVCFWTKKALRGEGACYKHHFYGIETHRCMEMSPAITCNQRCRHCWRDTSVFSSGWVGPVDEPSFIVRESMTEREGLLHGFGGNDKVSKEAYAEAISVPSHIAISLTGEPCMYPRLPELVRAYFSAGAKTIFLVTSGTVPERLREFAIHGIYPTNIYLSMEGRTKEEYQRLCIPVIEDAWEKVRESEEILRETPTRTVMRITCIKGENMDDPSGFLPSIQRMQPDYIETKGYMFLGYSMLRLRKANMPAFGEVEAFAKRLAGLCGYAPVDSQQQSNVVLLKRRTPRPAYDDGLYAGELRSRTKD